MDDQKIIELFEKREESAIAETQNAYGKYMHTIAYNVLRNNEDSEECVSESCLKTWNAIPPEKPLSLKAFVGRITRNTALDYLDKENAMKRGGGEAALCLEELSECVGSSDNTADAVIAKELSAIINEMLSDLSIQSRRIFVLRYYYLYSVKEIADIIGANPGKISTSLSRSRSMLLGKLKQEGYFK